MEVPPRMPPLGHMPAPRAFPLATEPESAYLYRAVTQRGLHSWY